jgi:hypothetical protein
MTWLPIFDATCTDGGREHPSQPVTHGLGRHEPRPAGPASLTGSGGSEDDLDGSSVARGRANPEISRDGLGPQPHVRDPIPGRSGLLVEPDSVVRDGDHATTGALRDRDLDVARACMPTRIPEAFLDDAKHLDLLVRGKPHLGVDIHLDVEFAVGAEDFHVATERRIEPGGSSGRRQREHGESRLLLRQCGGDLQLWEHLRRRSSRLEHAHVRRDGEQVLGETVVDLPGDPRALVGDGPAELGLGDGTPNTDEERAVRDEPQEVTLQDLVARDQRLEDEVQVGEERERGREAQPAVEVPAVAPVAQAEANDCDEPESRKEGRRKPHERALNEGGDAELALDFREAKPECRDTEDDADADSCGDE